MEKIKGDKMINHLRTKKYDPRVVAEAIRTMPIVSSDFYLSLLAFGVNDENRDSDITLKKEIIPYEFLIWEYHSGKGIFVPDKGFTDWYSRLPKAKRVTLDNALINRTPRTHKMIFRSNKINENSLGLFKKDHIDMLLDDGYEFSRGNITFGKAMLKSGCDPDSEIGLSFSNGRQGNHITVYFGDSVKAIYRNPISRKFIDIADKYGLTVKQK